MLRLLFLALMLGTAMVGFADALKEVPLPHLDIFMLCSNDILGRLDYVRELDGFYTDLLPAATDVMINSGSQEFDGCSANENRTQVTVTADGIALFDEESPLDQAEVQALVTMELLAAYFENICEEMDSFEALVSDAGSEPQIGIATAFGALVCEFDVEFVEAAARTGMIVAVILSIIVCCCVCGCILFCCGAFT